MSASQGNAATATPRIEPPPRTMTVWAGEWPYVKRGVSEVRQAVFSASRTVSNAFDVPGYLAMARKYGKQVDAYVTDTTVKANQEIQAKKWVLPATAIAVLSVFVVVRSAPWGGYKMLRNGTATALALTLFSFPSEIVSFVDSYLPFSKDPLRELNGDLLDQNQSSQRR